MGSSFSNHFAVIGDKKAITELIGHIHYMRPETTSEATGEVFVYGMWDPDEECPPHTCQYTGCFEHPGGLSEFDGAAMFVLALYGDTHSQSIGGVDDIAALCGARGLSYVRIDEFDGMWSDLEWSPDFPIDPHMRERLLKRFLPPVALEELEARKQWEQESERRQAVLDAAGVTVIEADEEVTRIVQARFNTLPLDPHDHHLQLDTVYGDDGRYPSVRAVLAVKSMSADRCACEIPEEEEGDHPSWHNQVTIVGMVEFNAYDNGSGRGSKPPRHNEVIAAVENYPGKLFRVKLEIQSDTRMAQELPGWMANQLTVGAQWRWTPRKRIDFNGSPLEREITAFEWAASRWKIQTR